MTSVALPAKVNPNVDATFEDALFMVVVRSKDSEDASDTLPTFQAVMPADSVVACDARGGLAARRPSSVQLLTRDRVSIALYSSTLDAAAVVDGWAARGGSRSRRIALFAFGSSSTGSSGTGVPLIERFHVCPAERRSWVRFDRARARSRSGVRATGGSRI